MTFNDGIGRDLRARQRREQAAADEAGCEQIAALVPLVRTGQMSPRRFLDEVRQVLEEAGRAAGGIHQNGETR